MKRLAILAIAALTANCAVGDVNHASLDEFLDHLVGQWVGGGLFTLDRPTEFDEDTNNDLRLPAVVVAAEDIDFTL